MAVLPLIAGVAMLVAMALLLHPFIHSQFSWSNPLGSLESFRVDWGQSDITEQVSINPKAV